METCVITGSGAAASLVPPPYCGIQVKSINITLPMDEMSSATPCVTLSGSVSGLYSFYNNIEPDIRFGVNETVTVTTANFTDDYSAVIKYVLYGNGQTYYIDINKAQLPLPNRLIRNPRDGS